MRTKMLVLSLGVLPAALLGGCLHVTRSDILYLTPDGAVDWCIVARDIMEPAGDSETRMASEQEFVQPFADQTSPFLEVARELGATRATSQLVRTDRPYMILVQARFPSVEALAQKLVKITGGPAEVHLARGEGQMSLLARITVVEAPERDTDEFRRVRDFLTAFEGLEVVLTDGAFVSGRGFDVTAGSRVARWDLESVLKTGTEPEPGDVFELSLTWTVPASR